MQTFEAIWYALIRGLTEIFPVSGGFHTQVLAQLMTRQYEAVFTDLMALGLALGIAFYYRKDIFKRTYKKPALFVQGIIASLAVFILWELVGNVLLARLGGVNVFVATILALVSGIAMYYWPQFSHKTAKKGQVPDAGQWTCFVATQALAPITGLSSTGLLLMFAQKCGYNAKKSVKNCLCLLILPLFLTGLKILVIPDRFSYLTENLSLMGLSLAVTIAATIFAISLLAKNLKKRASLRVFGAYTIAFASIVLIFELSK